MIIDIHEKGFQGALYGIVNWKPGLDWDFELGYEVQLF